MKKFIQIYTGAAAGRNITCDEVKNRLEMFGDNLPDGIIVGWSLDQHIYMWLRDYTVKRKMELYLWFQVLSEFKSLKDFVPVRDIDGIPLKSVRFDHDEEFSFYCPSDRNTLAYIKEIYEQYFSGIHFDGIFLDRIRFPSSSFDKNAVFSCGCSSCRKKYEEQGITKEDLNKIQVSIHNHREDKDFLGIEEYKDGRYRFKDKLLEKYLYTRTNIITEMIKNLSGYFKAKGLKIGLDLFAPCLSLFVGQNYEELSKYADFVKPMLYRYTDTPAGIMYELRGIAEALSEESTAAARLDHLKDKIGMEGEDITGFMIKEMRNAKKMSHCHVFAGMEIHTLPELKQIHPERIAEGVKRLAEMNAAGRIASWNIMVSGQDNISAFMGGAEDEA